MITTDYMMKQKAEIQNTIDRIVRFIDEAPQDRLICRRQSDVYRYSMKRTGNSLGEKEEYYLNRQSPLLMQLAKRDYYKKMLKDLRRELKAAEEYLRWHRDSSEVAAYLERHPGLRQLLPEVLVDKRNRYYQWANAEYPKNLSHPEHLIFITDGGFYVRSKSEQMIANMLLSEEIPFRYEDPVYLPGGEIIYPDFHLFSLRDYKEWYLEHNGRMLQEDYYRHYLWKLDQMRSAGIVPGVNLLQTFEAEGYPLEPDCVRSLIRLHLK